MALSLVSSQPSVDQESPPLEVGDLLGPYVVERVLGEGSMGRVYLGRHQRLGRNVALKVLHARLVQDRQLVQRLMKEGRVVNQISHQHIVEVHDFVEELMPERVYCVMEYLRGETLSHRLSVKPTPMASLVRIARQVASALGAAHAVGVVHRDLKPDNVFLVERDGADDFVKVLDFGVAKAAPGVGEVDLVQSQQGVLLGTPRYMAPEQVAGLDVDQRTDIYALGAILYELLTGKPPFDAPTFGQLAADIITKPPPPLPKVSISQEPVPSSLAALIYACLAKKPAERPATMAVVEGVLGGKAFSGRRPRWVVPAALVGAIGAGVLLVLALRPPPPVESTPVVAPPPAKLTPPPVVPALPDEVTLRLTTQPSGARVVRLDTGEVLGATPLERTFARSTTAAPLRLELAGYEPLQREVTLDQNLSLELSLKAVPKAKTSKVVTDGVIDPY